MSGQTKNTQTNTHTERYTNCEYSTCLFCPLLVISCTWTWVVHAQCLTDPTFRVTDCRFGSRCVTEKQSAPFRTITGSGARSKDQWPWWDGGEHTEGERAAFWDLRRRREHSPRSTCSKRRTFEGNEQQAAYTMKGVATVETQLMIGGDILALTDNNVNLSASTEELKVSFDRTRPRRNRQCESLDLGHEDALTKLEELRARVRTVGNLNVLGDRFGRVVRIITSKTGDQHISHSQ